ncbi:PEP-CTERM sorting domain-containing protein [Thalassotalea eurytherma]|uniref:Ice-binding protein C-terminal domain-containing protein n=1 Tax=Thalassotalea eurytherma TaxID=1144278 RepID=A0ABQ6HAJ6_9GAMM|nr:PEP-CTERM sorting domain-containing protein [Thalassotalea eurytherma]GLX83481.1 hypothetical protein theurythT_29340 [Thalassotalea eurytherma]
MKNTYKLLISSMLLAMSTGSQAGLIDLIDNTTAATGDYGNVTVTFGGIFPEYDASVLDENESMIRTSYLLEGVTQQNLRDTGLNGIGSANPADFTGLYVETFDTRTTLGQDLDDADPLKFPGTPHLGNNTQGVNSGCGVNGVSSGVTVAGDYGVTNQNIGGTAVIDRGVNDNNQGINTTCFAYTPTSRAALNPTSEVALDFSGILDSAGQITNSQMYVDYLGFFWGTIDSYNSFDFYRDNELIAHIDGLDLFNDFGGLNLGRNGEYVNFIFDEDAGFDKLVVTSSGIATEFDNIVNRIVPVNVPEPSTLAIFALGCMGLALRKTKRI